MSDADRTLETISVLLVEDEPGLQEAFAIILELEGCSVVRASDGREALTRLANFRPDIIVTDYMMPRMTGAELISHVRNNNGLADLPILLMSAALPRHVDKRKANLFLPKPVDVETLLNAVRSLTANQRRE